MDTLFGCQLINTQMADEVCPVYLPASVGDLLQSVYRSKENKTSSNPSKTYAVICNYGLELQTDVGNALVSMFVECGNVLHAQQQFNRLPSLQENSWTSLIQGYTKAGIMRHALALYDEMLMNSVDPSKHTFVAVLKACGKLRSINEGRRIHSEIIKEGLEIEHFIGSILVDMYFKCNSPLEAKEVFCEIPQPNVVCWTALIAGYAENGFVEEVLESFDEMQAQGICPNRVTLIYCLKACVALKSIDKGRKMHSRVLETGLEMDDAISNTLLEMYFKHGFIKDAETVFKQHSSRNVVLWTSMIVGHVELGFGEDALGYLDQMKLNCVPLDSVAVISSLKASSIIQALHKGREIHGDIIKLGLEQDISVVNSVVDMYAKRGSLEEAKSVFELCQKQGFEPDIISWTTLISGFSEEGETDKALQLFARMLDRGVLPNYVTFVSLLSACGNSIAFEAGRKLHAQVHQVGKLEANHELILATALIDMYNKFGCMYDSHRIFNTISLKDTVVWNTLIAGYASQGETDIVFSIVDLMLEEGKKTDSFSFLSVLTACSHSGLLEKSQHYLKSIIKDQNLSLTIEQINCIVDMLCRAGRISEALEMLKIVNNKGDFITWSIILNACQIEGDIQFAEKVFDYVLQHGYGDDDAPYVLISNLYAKPQVSS